MRQQYATVDDGDNHIGAAGGGVPGVGQADVFIVKLVFVKRVIGRQQGTAAVDWLSVFHIIAGIECLNGIDRGFGLCPVFVLSAFGQGVGGNAGLERIAAMSSLRGDGRRPKGEVAALRQGVTQTTQGVGGVFPTHNGLPG